MRGPGHSASEEPLAGATSILLTGRQSQFLSPQSHSCDGSVASRVSCATYLRACLNVMRTVFGVAAGYVVVDAGGEPLDLMALVEARARRIEEAVAVGEAVLSEDGSLDGLAVRVRGVRVCTGFKVSARSQYGGDVEAETVGGA